MLPTFHCACHLRLGYGARIVRRHFFNVYLLRLAQPDDLVVNGFKNLGDRFLISSHDQTLWVCISFNTHSLPMCQIMNPYLKLCDDDVPVEELRLRAHLLLQGAKFGHIHSQLLRVPSFLFCNVTHETLTWRAYLRPIMYRAMAIPVSTIWLPSLSSATRLVCSFTFWVFVYLIMPPLTSRACTSASTSNTKLPLPCVAACIYILFINNLSLNRC